MLHRITIRLAVALLVAACGAPAPSPAQTPAPSPSPASTSTPTVVPSVSAPIARSTGGSVSVPGGPTFVVPAGSVAADTTATIGASIATAPAETDEWPAVLIGPAWEIDLGGQALAAPATLIFHFDPSALPVGVSASGLLVAYLDPVTKTWVPVPATIDPSGTATATITHLSDWGLFGFDPARWLITLKALASGSFTESLTAFAGLLTNCDVSGGGFDIDNANAHNIIEGCVRSAAKGTASVEVTNLRAYALSVSSSPVGYVNQRLDPGQSVTFPVKNSVAPPVTVNALMTADDLWWSVTDIVMRMLPGWSRLKASPSYTTIVTFAAAGTKAVWDASKIGDDILAHRIPQAAEKTVALLTDRTYLDALVAVLGEAAVRYDQPWLAILDAPTLKEGLLVIHLGDLIVTTWSFFGDSLFLGISDSQVSVGVTWKVSPPVIDTSVDSCQNPGGLVFDGTNMWVTCVGSQTVQKRVAATGSLLGTYRMGVNPTSMVFDGTNIWVANDFSPNGYPPGTVTKLVAATGAVVGTYRVGHGPAAILYDGTNIWVAGGARIGSRTTVAKIDAATGGVIGEYAVGTWAWGLAYDGTSVWVGDAYARGRVTKISAATGAVGGTYDLGTGRSLGFSQGVLFDGNGSSIWVTDALSNTVTKLNASSGAVVGTYRVGVNPNAMAFDGTSIWVNGNTVTRLAADTGALMASYNKIPTCCAAGPLTIADGTSIWVTQVAIAVTK